MKHSFKRLLSMAMALVMVLSCVPVQVFAEECAHEYGVEIADASCTEPGSIVYTCGLCGDTYEEAGEEPAGHNYEVAEIPATCLEDGLITYTCTFCGESETESGEAALGHSYADGFCENCGEADPEAEEPIEEPAKEPEQELTEVSAPDPVASDSETGNDGEEIDGSEMPEEGAVAQLGPDGDTFTTLEAAIETAAAIDISVRPFVSLLVDCTVNETIVIDTPINIFYIGGDGNNPTITAAEGVDTLFEITENGELLFNDVDMVTPGDYIINITGNNATFMAVNCNLSGGDEAAINVADNVNWYYPPTEQWIPTTIQVYNSTVGGRTALHLGGSNATATFAPGNENGAVKLMGDNPDGVIVIDGDGHDIKMYETSIETNAGNHTAFTMNGDSVIEIGGGSFNGDSIDEHFNGWGEPLPQSGAVARVNAQYFGSLQSALNAAAEYEFEEGEVPLTILEELTIDNTVTLPETKTPIRMLGENITLTETGAINVYGQTTLELDGENRIWMGLGTVHVFEGGDLRNDWQVIGHVTWEENGTAPHLSAYWVHNYGEGWFENIYEYHPHMEGIRMAPGEDHCLSFYKNVWDPDNGRWIRTSVGAGEMTLSGGLTAYAMTGLDWVEGNFKPGAENTQNYVQLYVNNDAPWDQEQTVTVDGISFTVNVAREPYHGFYSDTTANNANWLLKYRYNKFRNENSFYFIFTAPEEYKLTWAGLENEDFATIEATADRNVWKIILNEDALKLIDGNYRDFELRVFMDVKDSDGNDHEWDYSIWCEPWIWNVQAGDDISHVDMMYEIDAFHNVDSWALGWIMDGDLTLDPNVNNGELDIDMGWRDDKQRYFRLSDECGKGTITVPAGTKLIVNTPMEIYGGKIVIENGGEMVINQPVVVNGYEINGVTYGRGCIDLLEGGKITKNHSLTVTEHGDFFNNGVYEDNGDGFEGITLDELMNRVNEAIERGEGELWLNEDAVLYGDLDMPDNFHIFTGFGTTITVPRGQTLNLGGNGMSLNGSTLDVYGTLNAYSALYINNGSHLNVKEDAVLNIVHSMEVGIHKEDFVQDYAGVVDVVGTMNVCGYVYIGRTGDGDEDRGILNVYNKLNLVQDTSVDYDRFGLLEIAGTVDVGAGGVVDLSAIPEGMSSIDVSWSGALITNKAEDEYGQHESVINVPNRGTVTTDAANNPRVDGIDPEYMIGSIYGGTNFAEFKDALDIAAEAVGTYYDVRVNLWDTTIELEENITIPNGVALILNNNGDGYYEELIIPEGMKLTNDATIVLNEETALRNFGELENNGTIILEQWSSMVNYGTLSGTKSFEDGFIINGGDYAEGNTSQSDLEEALANMSANAGGWIHESVTELTENMTIDLGIRESDDVERTFKIAKYGQIIVPEGVTLTLNSPTMLNGGQIIVENGGELIVNNMLHIGSGTLYMENDAYLDDQNGDIMGVVTWQDDEKPDHVSAYIVADNWDEDSNRYYFYNTIDEWEWGASHDQQVLPGYGRALIFYLNHWNAEETIWERTPIHPDELTADDGLTIMHLMDDFNPDEFGIRGDQKYGDCFVMLRTDADESLWDTTRYVRYGTHSFPVYIQRDQEMGFYSAPEASNETFLDSFGFAPGADNSFYFIVTDPSLTALKLYTELQAGPEVVRDGVYCEKVGYNTWKMQLDDSVTENMGQNYWLQVRVQVKDTEGNQWYTTRGLNCAPWIWMRGMPDAMLEFNNEEYRYYAEADQWQVSRWIEDEEWEEGGFWSDFDTELPQGVSYDLDSNTLTLNGVSLETLGIGYHWVNEHEDTEGYNLPNSDLIIEVHGDNNIGGGRNAFWLRGDVNATIAGDGSLNIENDNSEQLVWNANAVDVEDSTLTIGGSVEITMEVSGQNWWDFEGNDGIGETPCTMHAIQGDGTSNLIITDSAKVTVRVPDLREQEIDGEVFGYRGLANFANVTVERQAVLNLDTLHLYEGQKFIQNGGTITVTDPGTIAENGTKFYEPVVVRDGSRVQINGGTMNLTLDDTSDNARGTIIKVENNSTLQISGGQLVIRNNVKAPGIYVDNASWLYVTGGTMLYYDDLYALCGERTPVINVDGYADFTGGTIRVENGEFYFNSWNEAAPMIQWRGTNLIAKNTIIEQNGTFKMSGGKLQLTNSRIHANNETAFSGGTVTMNDSVLIANGATAVDGVAQLNFNVTDAYYTDTSFEGTTFKDNCVIEVKSYFSMSGHGNITINAKFTNSDNDFSGVHNSGTFHQMGGTVTVNSNGNASAFDSFGDMLLNFGTMSLSGGVALRVEEGGMVQTMDGMTLNVTGREQAVQLCGTADIAGGSLNVTADNGENKGGGHGIYVGENALLDFTGGIHSFHTGSIGIHADKGTVNIAAEPMITMESGVALFSVGTEEDNNVRFHFAEGSTLLDTDANAAPTKWLTDAENQYVKMLSADGEVPTTNLQINIGTVKTLLELLPELETVTDEHGNVRHLLKQTAIVDKSMVLEDTILDVMEGGMLIIRNGAELTIPDGSSHLIAMDGGRILVENGRIVNGGIMAADGGSIIVNNDGYEALESGVLNVHFHEVQVLDDGGNYVDEIYVSEVRGIPLEEQILDGTVDTTNGLTTVLNNYTGLGYSQVRIWTGNDMDLSGQYIPADTSLSIDGYETAAEVTVGTGTELCIDGELNLGNVEFTVNGGLTNYGYIGTDIHDNAKIIVNGSFGNHGQILLNRATMDVNGTFKLWNHDANLEVNDGSVIHVHTNGQLINNGTLWVGYWKQSQEEAAANGCEYIEGAAGTINVDGQLEVWLQMNVDGGSVVNVNEGGSLTVSLDHEEDIYGGMNLSGEMNIASGGNFDVENYLEIYGTLNVAGNMTFQDWTQDPMDIYGTVNVTEGGQLTNKNAMNLYGEMNVSGTLINGYEIWMQDTEEQKGASLILGEGGTLDNDGSLYNASHGGTVDVTQGEFINRAADPDDPDDYDAEVLTRYFADDTIAAMNGIDKGMIVLTYDGADTAAAERMAGYAEDNGYGISLFRVDGAASVAIGQQLTVDTIVMLNGSQLGVNGTLISNNMLRLRPDARMAISSVGHVYINGALRVDPADDDNNLSAAVLNNWGILECGSQGVLDIWGEYNDSGEVYINMAPTEYNDGYNVGGFTVECVISEENAILVMDVAEQWHVDDLLTWVVEDGYRGGIIRIDTAVEINHDLYIPENVTVEISDSGSLHMDGVLNNNSTIVVDGNDCALTAADAGSYTGAGTYSGYCGNDEAPKALTWTVKNNVLTISGNGVMGNYSEETPAPWKYFSGNISRIVLGDDVTNIGSSAFSGFDATMTIPTTVKTFGEQPFGNCTLKIYHKSDAETFVKGENSGVAEEQILFFHVIDPETGICTGCEYSLNAILNNDSTTPAEKTEELKSFDSDSLKSEMEKSEELVEQLDQLEQELGSVTSVEVGIKHSEDVSTEIADAFSNVHEDAAIVGAVLNAEEGVEEVNLVIGDPENTLDETQTEGYNMDASVHFSMTMEGVGDASQLDIPVKITLPIPDSIFDLTKLIVKHFHAGGEEDLSKSCVVTVDEDGKAYVSFVITGFSDFLLAQKATPVTLKARVSPSTVNAGTALEDVFISITAYDEDEKSYISGLSTSYVIQNAEEAEISLEEALKTPGTYTVVPGCLAPDAQYLIDPVPATLTVKGEEYVCVNTTTGEQYESLAEALEAAKSGDTVRLTNDYTETEEIIIRSGITLDIGAYTLTAMNNMVGFDGSYLDGDPFDIDGSYGKLITHKSFAMLTDGSYVDEKNYSILPIYYNDGYVFTRMEVNTDQSKDPNRGLVVDEVNDVIKFQFVTNMTGDVRKNILNDGAIENNVSIVVRLEWESTKTDGEGIAYQDFVYNDGQIAAICGGGKDFTLTLEGYSALYIDLSTLVVKGIVKADCGAAEYGSVWGTQSP